MTLRKPQLGSELDQRIADRMLSGIEFIPDALETQGLRDTRMSTPAVEAVIVAVSADEFATEQVAKDVWNAEMGTTIRSPESAAFHAGDSAKNSGEPNKGDIL